MKQTVLYNQHISLSASMVDFAGFMMPVKYTSIIDEHLNVRKHCGLFDVSHMGQIKILGKDAKSFLQYLIANNVDKLRIGQVIYSPLLNETGGVVDDILIYMLNETEFLLVVNASNIEKDFTWIQTHLSSTYENVSIDNMSMNYSMIALQGPDSEKLMKKTGFELADLSYYEFKEIYYKDEKIIISRTGYTGEVGFEIILENSLAESFWIMLLNEGKEFNLKPVGLGARDSLRLEVCFPLYGHELQDDVLAIESGVSWAIDMNKESFIGREALVNTRSNYKLIAFEMVERGIPRAGYDVCQGDNSVGKVTSGSFLPSLKKNMGLALVRKEQTEIDSEIFINIRSKYVKAKIVKKPFLLPFNRRKN